MKIIPLTEQEIQQFRAGTKGTAQKIHFNNAGASMPLDVVVETVVNYLNEEAMLGGYETEAKYHPQLENTYSLVARLINAEKDEVALVENASTGWILAFNGIDFKKGDVVITSEMEYVTNLIGFLNAKKTHGIEIRVIPNDERGNFQPAVLEKAIIPRTKLIAITHIPSTAGAVLPVVEIGKIRLDRSAVVTTDTYPGKRYQGRVSFISSAAEFTPKSVETHAERVTLVYRIKIDIENPTHELVPGMPADATLQAMPPGNP